MSLKEQMLSEMVISHENLLEQGYPSVKDLFKLGKDGAVVIQDPEKYSSENLILLFLIAKVYSEFLQFSKYGGADNTEIEDKLRVNPNTVRGKIKILRDNQLLISEVIDGVKLHKVNLNLLDQSINQILSTSSTVNKMEVV